MSAHPWSCTGRTRNKGCDVGPPLVGCGQVYIWEYLEPGEHPPTYILKTRKSLRALHFHPTGLNLLLTAEVRSRGEPPLPSRPGAQPLDVRCVCAWTHTRASWAQSSPDHDVQFVAEGCRGPFLFSTARASGRRACERRWVTQARPRLGSGRPRPTRWAVSSWSGEPRGARDGCASAASVELRRWNDGSLFLTWRTSDRRMTQPGSCRRGVTRSRPARAHPGF